MRRWSKLLFAVPAAVMTLLALTPPPDTGKDLFARRCSGCHALDTDREGPRLRGVFGRKAAGISSFPYSDALKKTNFRWDETSLDRWLTDPDALVPDADMAFRLDNAGERKAVIAYLKSLTKR